ncbi:MAG: 50S ribosomal protein L23 [Gammaproteobacteria bacterium]|nr:50S ribosomal protein L23 [Gammaproteobacteria bacterium]MDE2345066.1 50S ribosomal protein L23 [Gammaproteobacteria bacterium]
MNHNQEKAMRALLGPHVSEKATQLSETHNQVVFRVRQDADKDLVRRAVEKMFDVKVIAVRIVNVRGKTKRFGQRVGARSNWKKAYVRLAPGSTINFMGEKA